MVVFSLLMRKNVARCRFSQMLHPVFDDAANDIRSKFPVSRQRISLLVNLKHIRSWFKHGVCGLDLLNVLHCIG